MNFSFVILSVLFLVSWNSVIPPGGRHELSSAQLKMKDMALRMEVMKSLEQAAAEETTRKKDAELDAGRQLAEELAARSLALAEMEARALSAETKLAGMDDSDLMKTEAIQVGACVQRPDAAHNALFTTTRRRVDGAWGFLRCVPGRSCPCTSMQL